MKEGVRDEFWLELKHWRGHWSCKNKDHHKMAVVYCHILKYCSERLIVRVAVQCFRPLIQSDFLAHHYAGVELVEALHGAIAEAVTKVFLDEVGVVQDVVGHQRLLSLGILGTKKKKFDEISKTSCGGFFGFGWHSPAFHLVRYVLLLCGGVTFGVDESGVSHQVPSVLHNEAPTKYEKHEDHRRRDNFSSWSPISNHKQRCYFTIPSPQT